ncbi:putative O-methyltransferase domain, S-adenosyl-L-methionine-dependent methyltransferase [Dioscorea sansibarensis]
MFNDGMASDSVLVGDVVMMTCRDVFKGLKSLVDVGGGTGTMARAIAHAFPETKCTVLDLPHVIDTVKEDNSLVDYVGGDMFVSVPHANATLLKWILHVWNDEECVQILQRCKEAIPKRDQGGKIIIIDIVMGATTDKHPYAVETQLLFDLLVMIHLTGKERSESEWRSIILAAGFKDYKITPLLGLRSIIEIYP